MENIIHKLRQELQDLKKDYDSRFRNIEERLILLEKNSLQNVSSEERAVKRGLAEKLKLEINDLNKEHSKLINKDEFEKARSLKNKILQKQQELKKNFKEFIEKLNDSPQKQTANDTTIPVIPPVSPETLENLHKKVDVPKTTGVSSREKPVMAKEDKNSFIKRAPANDPSVAVPSQGSSKPGKESAAMIAEIFAALLVGPLGSLISKTGDIYRHYKEQGKLPVLFLTAAGIITLVSGFGFILQYSFTNLLDETAKVSIGFLASVGVILLGIKVIHIKDEYREYGSSLVGLGIILIYLCIYFIAEYYKFIPATVGFGLIFINTVAAYFLALRYETKVVSLISFLGGAFVPFVLGSFGQREIFYFSFLLLLCVSTIYLGKKIRWSALVYVSFLVAAAIIEYTVFGFSLNRNVVLMTLLIHGFAYIYIYYAIFDGFSLRKHLKKEEMLILGGAVSLLLLNLFQVFQKPEIPGYIYGANSIPFFSLAMFPYLKPGPRLRAVLFLIAGLLLGLAVPAVFHFKIMALFWVQEAFLLLMIGFLYNLVPVRREAFIVALVAVGQSIMNLPIINNNWNRDLYHWLFNAGMMNLVAIGIILFLFSWGLWKYSKILDPPEKTLRIVVNEIISLWVTSVFIMAALYFLPKYGLAFAVIAMPLLFARAKKKSFKFTRGLGYAAYGMLLVQAGISVNHLTALVPEIFSSWEPAVFLKIILHLTTVGAILIASNIIFLKMKDTLGYFEDETKFLNNELISVWALGTFLLADFYLVPWSYALVPALIPMPFLFIRAAKKKFIITRIMALGTYCMFLVFILLFLVYLENNMVSCNASFKEIAFQKSTLNLLVIGISLGTVIFVFRKIYESMKPFEKQITLLNNELFSAWILGAFLFCAYYIHEPFMWGLAVLPMPLLFIRSYRVKLPVTQVLAFVCYFLILVQASISIGKAGTFSFSKQDIYGKIAYGEAFLLLWAFQWFFQWQMPDHPLMKYMKNMRIFFYLMVPLIFIPHVVKYHIDYLPIAVWGSVALSVVLYEIIKTEIIKTETVILAVCASFITFITPLVQTGSLQWQPVAGLILGLVLLWSVTLWKGGFKRDQDNNIYSAFFKVSFIYPVAAAFSATYYFTGSPHQGLLVSGSCGLGMFLLRKKLPPVMEHKKIYYRLGQAFIILGLIIDVIEGRSLFYSSLSVSLIITIAAFLALTSVTFFDRDLFMDISKGDENSMEKTSVVDNYLYHGVVIAIYMTIIRNVTGDWFGPAATVLPVVHAIFIMFYSTFKDNRKLLPLYESLFAVSAAKIIFYDLRDFSLFEKIMAFTLIGIIMLGAAYFMQRFVSKRK